MDTLSTARPPATLDVPIDAARPIRVPISEVATPRTLEVSPVSRGGFVDEFRVNGATPVTAQRAYQMPGGIGDTIYEPQTGNFGTARPRPTGLRQLNPAVPINQTAASPNVSAEPLGTAVAAPPAFRRVIGNQSVAAAVAAGREGVRQVAGNGPGRFIAGVSAVAQGWGAASEAYADGGGFFEVASSGVTAGVLSFGGLLAGSAIGAAAVGAAGTAAGSVAPGVGNAIGGTTGLGLGALAGGYVGSDLGGRAGKNLGRRYGRFVDNAIPDVVLPKPPILPRWAWPFNPPEAEDYPNQTDPAALGRGPKTSEGEPGTVATGTVAGVLYRLEFSAVEGGAPTTREFGLGGPVSVQVVTDSPFGGYRETLVFTHDSSVPGATSSNPLSLVKAFTSQFGSEIVSGGTYTLARADGGQDPVIGNVPPTYAPNPARSRPDRPTRPFPPPRVAPTPGLQPTGGTNPDGSPQYEPGPNPWPGIPEVVPSPILNPGPAAPPNFSPSPSLGDAPVFDPSVDQPTMPDLFNPSETAPALDGNPNTPPVPEPLTTPNQQPLDVTLSGGTRVRRLPDGSLEITYPDDPNIQVSGIPGINAPPIQRPQVPLIIPVGLSQPAITPRNPNLPLINPNQPQTPSQPATNPNIDPTPPAPPPNTPNPNPRAICQYERSRVMDIQNKSTNTNQRASNPVSGFPGLYGLQIEARDKLGQTFNNTERIKERIRPEDFPITVPDQIAKANPIPRQIDSLAELGLWIVEQLDGVVGKWPMEVPVPIPGGTNQTLGVPNMSEAIAEMFGMMISQQVTAAQILNTSSRTLAQAGSATQQAALANMIAKGNAEFLGYSAQPTAEDMPLTYTPGKDPGEGLLEESTAKIRGWKNNDDTDLKRILQDLMHAAQIIKAVYWRRLDPKSDLKAQIDEQIKGKADFLGNVAQPSDREADDWEQYLRDTEAGFSRLSSDGTPYGRTPDEGPKIRDITPPEP